LVKDEKGERVIRREVEKEAWEREWVYPKRRSTTRNAKLSASEEVSIAQTRN
jgi:hypothetical protein